MADAGCEATMLLERISDGDSAAAEDLLPMVYAELRALAGSYFQGRVAGHTLQPTAVVHDAFIRLVGNRDIAWEGRSHFFAVAAKAMRNVLADHARRKRAEKRGGQWERVTLTDIGTDGAPREIDALDLEDALTKLAETDPRQAQIVELRFYGGLKVEEVARLLDVSPRTIELDWRMARAWLRDHLSEDFPA